MPIKNKQISMDVNTKTITAIIRCSSRKCLIETRRILELLGEEEQ